MAPAFSLKPLGNDFSTPQFFRLVFMEFELNSVYDQVVLNQNDEISVNRKISDFVDKTFKY